jgi:hypothetical protein
MYQFMFAMYSKSYIPNLQCWPLNGHSPYNTLNMSARDAFLLAVFPFTQLQASVANNHSINNDTVNVNGKRVHQVSECITPPRSRTFLLQPVMSQQHDIELLPREERVILAIQAMEKDPSLS